MAAPLAVGHTHVHALRTAAGAEALVARVLAEDGTAGYGFTLNLEAGVARDMAAWDALARRCKVPLYTLLGGARRRRIRLEQDGEPALAPDRELLRRGLCEGRWRLLRVDPFAWGSVAEVQTATAAARVFALEVALLAPQAHPWEIAWCAMLAAALPGEDPRVIVRAAPAVDWIHVPQEPGVGVDWALESGFAALNWLKP